LSVLDEHTELVADAEQSGSKTPANGDPPLSPSELGPAPGDPGPAEVPTSGEQAAAPTPSEPPGAHSVGEPPSPSTEAKVWRRWTVVAAALSALLLSILLALADALANLLNVAFGGGSPSAGTFVTIAIVGHSALALASAFLLGVGLANATRRRAAAVAAWVIIPVGIGWFFLWGQLAAG
jgi:hypothetical protein